MKLITIFVTGLLIVSVASGDPANTNAAPASSAPSAKTEDWIVNGRTFHNVRVTRVEVDRVHIMFDEAGVGTVALADLPPDLQKRFNYDPAAAKAASDARLQQEAQTDAEVAAEYAKEKDQKEQAEQLHDQRKEMAQHPCFMQGSVLQKTPDGILVQCDNPYLDGGYVRDLTPAGATRIYGKFLLKNAPNEASLVDGDAITQVCYACGTYQYTTVMGAQATVASYTAVLPGN